MAQEFETNNTRATIIGRRISWAAVFAGVVTGMAIQLLLSLLGVAIGASTIDPLRGDTPGKGIAIGAGIWFLLSGLVATYVGACVAAYLSGSARKSDRVLHAVLSWALASIVMAFLLGSSFGALVGGTMRVVSSAAGGATQQLVANATGNSAGSGAANRDLNAARNDAVGGVGSQSTETQSNEQRAREVGDVAAKSTAAGAWWSFAMLLLGLIVASYAGATERNYYHGVTGESARS